jgi:cell division protein FtsW (lipid II flippase)
MLLLSTYGIAMFGVLVITALSAVLFTVVGVVPKRSAVLLITLLLILLALFIFMLPQGKDTFSRLSNPYEDENASYRLWVLKQELGGSRSNLLIGHGSYVGSTMTTTGEVILGHSSFTSFFYEYGLLFIVPFLYLLFAAAYGFVRLIKRTRRPVEKAIVAGMAASLLSTFVLGFFDPIFMSYFQDSIIWLFIGFMTLWNNWLDEDPDAILIA